MREHENKKKRKSEIHKHTHTPIVKRNADDVMDRMEFVKVEFYSIRKR